MAAVWFRRGVRLHDNPALCRACELGNVIPVFILDPHFVEPHRIGVNQFSFFRQALVDLDEQLRVLGSRLVVLRGEPEKVWQDVFQGKCSFKVSTLLFEKDTSPYSMQRDEKVTALAGKHGVKVETFTSHTMLDIVATCNMPGFKAPTNNKGIEMLIGKAGVPQPLDVPQIPACKIKGYEMFTMKELKYPAEPTHTTKGGEREGLAILAKVCGDTKYVCGFNKTKTSSTQEHTSPKLDASLTTGLSPYLMSGAVSVRMVYHKVKAAIAGKAHTQAPESFLGQIYFREMFYILGHSTPNFDKDTNKYCLQVPWGADNAKLAAWQEGKTGYPYIDALMRQLNQTGWMHHLGRHAVACFLTRGDLWQSWEAGRDYFHKQLIDADGALNNGNWMGLAGVAPWSAPWFRIYSPIPDGKSALNVEMDGAFVRKFVPELKDMPTQYLFKPWEAPAAVQAKAKCVVGKDYPKPVVDHAKARNDNLASFKAATQARAAAAGKEPKAKAAPKARAGAKRAAVQNGPAAKKTKK
eukprot:CAMPEP_0204276956 /NCGR_PEP_ID=MMETSP0468-20130131/29025_1 /ASSEMBLY_ACC=CAM_ASM_000383 /TAXON_ID=2969 /ORGANISM="Oxyrrhis marina" /LENGTH=522 /DNA_ID=CAMNT_0051253665 /DNA_START=12 /DNA_END=1580 /DNA_ORIENTATION=+